ncbi:hypothetical protein thsrh120_56420 [Rhizobium sp. No.120]
MARFNARIIHARSKQGAFDPCQVLPAGILDALRQHQIEIGNLDFYGTNGSAEL